MSKDSSITAETLSYLFDRPSEPIFNGKGADGTVQFIIPDSYYTDLYKAAQSSIQNKFTSASTVYRLKELKNIPDITAALTISRKRNFSVFNQHHRSCSAVLTNIFLDAPNMEELCSLAAYIRDRVNPHLFTYSLSVAILHRKDTKNIELPSHLNLFPQMYIEKVIFLQAREEENIVPVGSRNVIDVPMDFAASSLEVEQRIAYFREDVGLNLHHWHWHLVYPFEGRREIVAKDRRGEIFYYSHQQIIARYNMERFCNRLPRVKRLINLSEPIEEGYYPKLDNVTASRVWPSRHPNTVIRNVRREGDRITVDIQDLIRWRERLIEAIDAGSYFDTNGQSKRFTTETGIDVLGNLIEASMLSENQQRYGNLHNDGHNIIAYIHDPENRFQELNAIMGDNTMNLRDPVFYRWHAYINYIFERYKNTLPAYELKDLTFENVQVTSIKITTGTETTGKTTAAQNQNFPENEIATFWQNADIDVARGLDFSDQKGSVYARVTHLQHAPFTYSITYENKGSPRMGTVRIYYAPKFDERNQPLLFTDQKGFFIELDRFTHNLKKGTDTIKRKSTDSSVTIPYELTFRSLANKPAAGSANEGAFNFCGCGWPQHMLIAKGTNEGFPCQLFVMISDYKNDQVQGVTYSKTCDDASSYCGLRDSKYPDKQAMGFPFDRRPRNNVQTVEQFLTPNMKIQDIKIRFRNRVVASIQRRT